MAYADRGFLFYWHHDAEASNRLSYTLRCSEVGFPKPRLLVFVFSLSQRVHAGEGDHSEYALAHPTAQCINRVGALHKVNIARRRASNIEAHCLLSSVRLSCLAHCRSQFCAAHRKSLSLHLPQAAVELVSPNVPQSLLGDALNPNKSDIYLAASRRYIPDLTSGLL